MTQTKLSEQVPEKWPGEKRKPKLQKRKKLSHCQLTVVTEGQGRIMLKESWSQHLKVLRFSICAEVGGCEFYKK